jgi:hypothetical protein
MDRRERITSDADALFGKPHIKRWSAAQTLVRNTRLA